MIGILNFVLLRVKDGSNIVKISLEIHNFVLLKVEYTV